MTGALQRAAKRMYDENGWNAVELEDGTGFVLTIEGSDGDWTAIVITDDTAKTFAFYSLAPVDAPADKLADMAEFLHRANHGLVAGSYELDYDTGESRLRSGLEFSPAIASILDDDELLGALLFDLSAANVNIFDHYLAGLVAVVHGGVPVSEIIADLESSTADS